MVLIGVWRNFGNPVPEKCWVLVFLSLFSLYPLSCQLYLQSWINRHGFWFDDLFSKFDIVLRQELQLSLEPFLFRLLLGGFFRNEQYHLPFEILVRNQVKFLLFPQSQYQFLIFLNEITQVVLVNRTMRESTFVKLFASTLQMVEFAWVVLGVVRKTATRALRACAGQKVLADYLLCIREKYFRTLWLEVVAECTCLALSAVTLVKVQAFLFLVCGGDDFRCGLFCLFLFCSLLYLVRLQIDWELRIVLAYLAFLLWGAHGWLVDFVYLFIKAKR